jgi:membrane protein YqaA with SNARE-associated domain
MFQTFQFPTLWDFRLPVAVRSMLLFAVGCLSAMLLPLASNYVLMANWLPGNAAMPFPSIVEVSTLAETHFPASLTHQEPNFYQ